MSKDLSLRFAMSESRVVVVMPAFNAARTLEVTYGLSIFALLFKSSLHKVGLARQTQFQSLRDRYEEVPSAPGHASKT